jgi:uncharacterized HAD superfamily protein/uncharacterized protein YdcH (DUF465 family)
MNQLHFAFLWCFFGVISQMTAQDIHVHYDVFRDSMYYRQNGKAVAAPVVRDGKKVVLHVENYNNYLYDVALKVDNTEIQLANSNPEGGLNGLLPASGGNLSPLDMLFQGGDNNLLGAFKMFPGLSGKDLKEGSGWVTSPEEVQRQEQVAQLKKMEAQFEAVRDKVTELDDSLREMESQAEAKLTANRLQTFAATEIAHLRFNPHLEPSQIKLLSADYMQRVFMEKDPNKIDLAQVLKIADGQQDISRYVKDYNQKVQQYAKEAAVSVQVAQEFRKFNFPNSNLIAFTKKAEDFTAAANEKLLQYKENAQMLEAKLASVETLDPQALLALRTTYIELTNNKFAKNYTHTATGEKMQFNIILTPLDSLQRLGIKEKTTPFEVAVYGGLRMRASVGLSFSQFFSTPQQYFVRDSVLQGSNKDAFTPIATSFLHFYAPSRGGVSLAGSFGIGVPIGGGDKLPLSFFLGPSLVFGRNERIVLNTGVMGGRVERLSQGYKIGDKFYADDNEAPTTSVYALGYFLGVSFNLTGK